MRLGKDLVGKPIYSVADGKLLGEVKDLYLDDRVTTVIGIFLGREGFLSRKDILVPHDAVVVFGLDAVLVKNGEAITDTNQYAPAGKWLRREKMLGRDVDTPGGTKVAKLGDVILNEEADVIGFSLSRVLVEGPIAEKRVVMRDAVLDLGDVDGGMTIDLAKVEGVGQEMPASSPEEPHK